MKRNNDWETIGIWIFRIVLVICAVVSALADKHEIAISFVVVLIVSLSL